MQFQRNVLEQKKARLAALNKQSDAALILVRSTIDGLERVNEDIELTVAEIDEYQKTLSETRSGLDETLHKNQRIMQNFKSLLCVE